MFVTLEATYLSLIQVGHWNATYSKAEERLMIHGSKNATRGRVDYLAKRTVRVVSILVRHILPYISAQTFCHEHRNKDYIFGSNHATVNLCT